MTELQQLMKHTLDDEPAWSITAADLVRRGRRRARARHAGGTATGLVIVASAAAVVFGVVSGGDVTDREMAASPTPTAVLSSSSAQNRDDDVITAATLPDIVESRGDLDLVSVRSQHLDKTTYVNLSAGIATVAGKRAENQYLNVQVFPGEKGSTWADCYGVSDLKRNGDGYYGPCTVRDLPGGQRLLERSGVTKNGAFAIAQATVVRKDGSGVSAEVSNQRVTNSHEPAPVVSARPPVSSDRLADLVRQLAALPVRR